VAGAGLSEASPGVSDYRPPTPATPELKYAPLPGQDGFCSGRVVCKKKCEIRSRARQEAGFDVRFLTGAAPRICFWTGT